MHSVEDIGLSRQERSEPVVRVCKEIEKHLKGKQTRKQHVCRHQQSVEATALNRNQLSFGEVQAKAQENNAAYIHLKGHRLMEKERLCAQRI